jgi:DNA-directed RNA polymerase specialized sigma24 family protein
MCHDGDGKRRTPPVGAISREEQLLLENDEYIVSLARKKVPRDRTHPESVTDDIDELAQRIRIKLWLISLKQDITAVRAYIRQVAATVSVDMVREQKPALALPVNEEGECYEGQPLFTRRQEEQDPAALLAQEESFNDCMELLARGVLELPTVQQQAMLYSLKKHIDDLLPFIEKLQGQGADVEGASMPTNANQQRSHRTSLSIARKKMRALHARRDF